MRKNLFVAALLAMSASGAMAQSKFAGFYGQLAIGYERVAPSVADKFVVNGVQSPAIMSPSNANNFTGAIGLGYAFELNKDFVLGVGVDYTIPGKAQNISGTVMGKTEVAQYKKKDSYSIFLAPGMVIGANGLAYAKLGFANASIETPFDTANYTGYLVGLGYKHVIDGGLYGFGEINYANYGDHSFTKSGITWSSTLTTSFSVTNVLVGVGYKF